MVKQEVSFSFEAIAELCDLNSRLLKLTGIDFVKQLTCLANNDRKTEIDAREFIRANYPVKNDHVNTALLLDFYLYWISYRENESAAIYGCCEVEENPDEKPFRSRCLGQFLNDNIKLSFTTGFFPKD